MSFSAAHHQYSLSGRGDGDMRPILASMDSLQVGARAYTEKRKGKKKEHKKVGLECVKCDKDLNGAAYKVSKKEGMGICCRRCHKEDGVIHGIYCTDCVLQADFCGTCERFFCEKCFTQVDLKDRDGNRYCSRKCAKARNKKKPQHQQGSVHNKFKQQTSNIFSNTQPVLVEDKGSNNPDPSYSFDTCASEIQTPTKSTEQQPSQSKMKYACAWCTKGLASTTSKGPDKGDNDTTPIGYYCQCSPNVYCNGCAINHGDFCAGACQKFSCRNCRPYDGWLATDASIFCSKECTPAELHSSVFPRNLFDEDWEAEEHFRPLSRRCQGYTLGGERCKVTAAHPGEAAKTLKQGDDYCLLHHPGGGYFGVSVSEVEEDSSDDNDDDYYFDCDDTNN